MKKVSDTLSFLNSRKENSEVLMEMLSTIFYTKKKMIYTAIMLNKMKINP